MRFHDYGGEFLYTLLRKFSLTLTQGRDVDLLFGLDMLKAHQACIDLEKNVLRIQGREVKFLAEHGTCYTFSYPDCMSSYFPRRATQQSPVRHFG